MPLHAHVFSFTHNAVVLWLFRYVHPENQTRIFWFLHFYESKQMSLTQDLKLSLEQSSALQLQCQTDMLLCTINCFIQWARPQNMPLGDLAFYYAQYLWSQYATLYDSTKDIKRGISFHAILLSHMGGGVNFHLLISTACWVGYLYHGI